VKAWTAKLNDEGLAPSYVYALHSRLSQLMADAVHDGVLARNPCSRRTSPGGAKQRACVPTTVQVWELFDKIPARHRTAVLLGAFASLRVAEACGLRVEDIDFMRGIIRPAVQYPAQPLKNATSRAAIPIPASMALELAAHVKAYPAATLLSTEGGGQVGPWMLERYVRAHRGSLTDAPVTMRYHDLRHYFASLLIAGGADVKVVQARLRHASATTTLNTYSHLWPDSDDRTRAVVEDVFSARAEYLGDFLGTNGV